LTESRQTHEVRLTAKPSAVTSDPPNLVYTVEIGNLELAEDYKQDGLSLFSMQELHDRFLSQGAPPVKFVRKHCWAMIRHALIEDHEKQAFVI